MVFKPIFECSNNNNHMNAKEIKKAIRKKYGTIRNAAEVKGVPVEELRKKLVRIKNNRGINKVKNPVELDRVWIMNEFL